MSDVISRADAIEAFGLSEKTRKYGGDHSGYDTMLKYEIQDVLENLPSAEALLKQEIDFHKEVSRIEAEKVVDLEHKLADAVHIHNDGTLEVKIPNAQKVGRVLVMDTDSRIGGGLFYPDDAEQGEWILVKGSNGKDYHKCSKCLHTQEITGVKNYCAVCGARMKGGAE